MRLARILAWLLLAAPVAAVAAEGAKLDCLPADVNPNDPVSLQRGAQVYVNYCMGCHSDRVKSGGLALSQLNLDAVDQSAEVAEKVVRKLRGGLMPPAGARRPDGPAARRGSDRVSRGSRGCSGPP